MGLFPNVKLKVVNRDGPDIRFSVLTGSGYQVYVLTGYLLWPDTGYPAGYAANTVDTDLQLKPSTLKIKPERIAKNVFDRISGRIPDIRQTKIHIMPDSGFGKGRISGQSFVLK